MNKLTDSEIVKALECCSSELDFCSICPYFTPDYSNEYCRQDMSKDSLDLINRQKAEIERLQKIIVGFMDEVGTWSNKYDVDISTIHKLPLLAKEDFNTRNKIKSEAIQQLREKCNEHQDFHKGDDGVFRAYISIEDLDNIINEM